MISNNLGKFEGLIKAKLHGKTFLRLFFFDQRS
jgi:hypothetical protein